MPTANCKLVHRVTSAISASSAVKPKSPNLKSPIDTIVFDLGNVLIDWSPAYLYERIFTDKEEQLQFLQTVCSMAWHNAQDNGRPVNEATEELVQQHPHLESPIRAFYGRWREMFRGPIEGTVQILSQLKDKGYRLYALSNWSAELFPQSKDDFPFLQWFDDILLSGEVQLTKPDPRIYQLLLSKYGLKPEQVLFIDDRQANVQAALQLGIDSIVFESPEQLEQQLITRQLL